MRHIKIANRAVPLWFIGVLLISGIGLSMLVYVWPSVIIPLEVEEPLEILSYPVEFSLFPGETIEFNITLQNHASINYSVMFDYQLNNSDYQANYVRFSDETYNVIQGIQTLAAWLFVEPNAPPTQASLTIKILRTSPGVPPSPTFFEDFTTYTSVDENTDFTITQNQIDISAMRRDANSYVYKNYSSTPFSGDFTHTLDAKITSINTPPWSPFRAMYWALWNDVGNWTALKDETNANGSFLIARSANVAGKPMFQLGVRIDGVRTVENSVSLDWDTVYYLKIRRDDNADELYCGIYTTADLRDAGDAIDGDKDNLLVPLSRVDTYDIIYAVQSIGSTSDGNGTITGWVRNLEL